MSLLYIKSIRKLKVLALSQYVALKDSVIVSCVENVHTSEIQKEKIRKVPLLLLFSRDFALVLSNIDFHDPIPKFTRKSNYF